MTVVPLSRPSPPNTAAQPAPFWDCDRNGALPSDGDQHPMPEIGPALDLITLALWRVATHAFCFVAGMAFVTNIVLRMAGIEP